MNFLYLCQAVSICYANGDLNDNSATKPEFWANLGLMLLEEKSVMMDLVHREFENEVAQSGDLVHTYRPNKFRIKRKSDTDEVEEQDAILDAIQVPLDQHIYTSFIIKDKEWSLNNKDLVRLHLAPAINAVSRGVDRVISGQVHRFLGAPADRVGLLNGLTPANTRSSVIAAQEKLDLNNVPEDERRLILSPRSRSQFLNTDLIVKANEAGVDFNAALRRAFLGDLFGFETFKSNNIPQVTDDATDKAEGTVTAALLAGEVTSLEAVTITGYEVNVGEWAVVAGNDQPQFITAATTGGGNTTAVTLNEAQKFASDSGAVLKVYKKADAKGAFAVGFDNDIIVDGHSTSLPPQVGQMLATGIGATRRTYTIIEAEVVTTTETKILLDRPLEVALADNEDVFPGPAGVLNLAFHREALALITRPLAMPPNNLGALFAVAQNGSIGIRVSMQTDTKKQGTRVNVDVLAGLALLDADMACPVLG